MITQLETFGKYPIVLLVAFAATSLVIPRLIPASGRLGLVAQGASRHAHRGKVPAVGGLAVFIGFHAACATIFLFPWAEFAQNLGLDWWLRFLPISAGVLILGAVDDRRDLRPRVKLGGQVLIAVAAFAVGFRVGGIAGLHLPLWVDLCVTAGWIVLILNAFNLVDGIDGLAAGLAAMAAIGIGASLVLRRLPGDVLVLVALFGCCAGFLRHNLKPSTVFLGDAGSMFLGFAVGTLALSTASKATTFASIAVPLTVVGIPVLDTTLAVWRRMVRRAMSLMGDRARARADGLFSPDRDHLHHRFVARGLSHRRVSMGLWMVAGVLIGAALLIQANNDRAQGLLLLTIIVGAYVVFRHLAFIELEDSTHLMARGVSRWSHHITGRLIYLVLDVGLVLGAFMILAALAWGTSSPDWEAGFWMRMALVRVAVPFIALTLFGVYDVVWGSARPSEYLGVGAVVWAGCLGAAGVENILWTPATEPWTLFHDVVFGLLAAGAVMVSRVARSALTEVGSRPRQPGTAPTRVAVHGVSPLLPEVIGWLEKSYRSTGKAYEVVALLDDDDRLPGRVVHGRPVLGGLADSGEELAKLGVTVVVTQETELAQVERLRDTAGLGGLKLLSWSPVLNQAEEPPVPEDENQQWPVPKPSLAG